MPLEPWLAAAFGALFGLLVGSFLNVVVHRLPKMMERAWQRECADAAAQPPADEAPYNLVTPRSRCPHCGHAIAWYENVPVVSWMALGGKCRACRKPISVRYPQVELATAALFGYCLWRWNATPQAAAWCLFAALLLALALIDWDTTLLPDDLNYPLLWAGLVAAALRWTDLPLTDAVWGAVGGYLSLWSVYWAFKLATGKEGMGYGDFKLFAALGAWFGWQALVPMILLASIVGAVIGIGMKFASSLREGGYVPFGPFLAGAGFIAMVFGPQTILTAIGL